jgi:hypothetical protein
MVGIDDTISLLISTILLFLLTQNFGILYATALFFALQKVKDLVLKYTHGLD